MNQKNKDAYIADQKAKHGDSVIYEDRGEIDMTNIAMDVQPCGAIDHTFTYVCKDPGIYRIFGNYRERAKGARWKQFDQRLCATHLAAWAALHGTTVEALLAERETK